MRQLQSFNRAWMLLDGRQYQVVSYLLSQWRESTRATSAEFIADFAQASPAANGIQVEGSIRSSGDHSYSDIVSVEQELASAYRGRESSLRKDSFADE